MDEKYVTMASKKMETENMKETKPEKARKVETESSEEMESEVKEEDIDDRTTMFSCAAEPKVRLEVKMMRSAMNKHFFIRDTPFSNLEDEYALRLGSVLTGKVSNVLAGPQYSTRSKRGHSNSAHDVFSKESVKISVRLMENVVASGPPGRIFCSNFVF